MTRREWRNATVLIRGAEITAKPRLGITTLGGASAGFRAEPAPTRINFAFGSVKAFFADFTDAVKVNIRHGSLLKSGLCLEPRLCINTGAARSFYHIDHRSSNQN